MTPLVRASIVAAAWLVFYALFLAAAVYGTR